MRLKKRPQQRVDAFFEPSTVLESIVCTFKADDNKVLKIDK